MGLSIGRVPILNAIYEYLGWTTQKRKSVFFPGLTLLFRTAWPRLCSPNIYSTPKRWSYFRIGFDHHLAIPTAASPRLVPRDMFDSLSSRLEAFMMLCPILVMTFQKFSCLHPLEVKSQGVSRKVFVVKRMWNHWLAQSRWKTTVLKIWFTLLTLWVEPGLISWPHSHAFHTILMIYYVH